MVGFFDIHLTMSSINGKISFQFRFWTHFFAFRNTDTRLKIFPTALKKFALRAENVAYDLNCAKKSSGNFYTCRIFYGSKNFYHQKVHNLRYILHTYDVFIALIDQKLSSFEIQNSFDSLVFFGFII